MGKSPHDAARLRQGQCRGARRRRRRGAARAGRLALGARRGRRQPPGADRRRALAALALARPQLDPPARGGGGAAGDRDHDRRRARPGGHAGRARPARRAPGARDLLRRSPRPRPRHPALCREIVRRGHSVQNHSDRHSHAFSLLGPRGLAREIGAAQARLADLVGVAPRFFRAPGGPAQSLARAGARAARPGAGELDPARLRHGPARAGGVLARLCDGLGAGDILLLHDGNAARTAPGSRWCSPSCRRCSSASPRPGCGRPPWPTPCPRAREAAAGALAAARDEPRRRGAGLAGAGRAGERLVPARRPLRPALRPRQAALGSGVSPSPRSTA